MRVLIIYNNDYGERFFNHIAAHARAEWKVAGFKMSVALPTVIDDPEDYIPSDLPQADLMIYAGQDRKLGELISDLAEASKAREVLVPVDNRSHLPMGLAKQVRRRLDRLNMASAFPAPFCSLRQSDRQGPLVREFAGRFGKPKLKITVVKDCLKTVEVVRGAPCGNTHFIAERIPGTAMTDVREETARKFHAHPCLGSMDMDQELGDTILHVAGHFVMSAVKVACKKAIKVACKNTEGTT